MCEIILVGFRLGDCSQNCQFARLKTSPKFPAIRYIARRIINMVNVLFVISIQYVMSTLR